MQLLNIIIPVYNAEKYIEECIQSIIKQKFTDYRIIIVNDGSTDHTGRICRKLKEKYESIEYVLQSNQGVSAARNKGIMSADARYLMFVDADDLLADDILQKMITYCEQYDFVMSGYSVFGNDESNDSMDYICPPYAGNMQGFATDILNYMNPPFILGPCFKLFDFSIIKENSIKFPEELSYGEDAIFVFEYLKKAKTIKCIPDVGYQYRKSESESLSSTYRKDKIDINQRINKSLEDLLIQNNVDQYSLICDSWFMNFFTAYIQDMVIHEDKLSDIKRIFHSLVKKYDVKKKVKRVKHLTKAQKIICYATMNPIFINVLYLFRIKNSIEELRHGK